MTALIEPVGEDRAPRDVPLLDGTNPRRTFAFRQGEPVTLARFLADVHAAAEILPPGEAVLNLCEDRYAFLVAFCAILARGQTNLLPSSRAPQALDDARAIRAARHALSDVDPQPVPPGLLRLPEPGCHGERTDVPRIAARQLAVIAFTSGSTGVPKPHEKRWDRFLVSSANNARVLAATLGLGAGQPAHIVATVPPQHMYGIEFSVLLPLTAAFTIHADRPFFPADIARALAEVPEPRVLVTTPVHLRALLRDPQELPGLGAIVSATAPLPVELARAAEARYGAPLVEVFGATETCVIAHRRTARAEAWQLQPGVELRPQPDGTLVDSLQLPAPTLLQDVVELLPERRFALRGRNADLLEIAGKRASLADLTQRVLALPGVLDAVVFQSDQADACGVQRIAALVVAPQRSEADLLAELRRAIDPVFLPRPLRRLDALPRNETGKISRAALLAAIGH